MRIPSSRAKTAIILSTGGLTTQCYVDKKSKEVTWYLNNIDYGQHHDVQQLENGNILFFANGADVHMHGPEGGSAVVEVDPQRI